MENLSMVKGKIVLVAFPFDDFSEEKIRPVLCLTEFIGPHKHILVAFITSKVKEEVLDTDILINKDDKEFKETGLSVSSKVQLHRIMTISSSAIKRELGSIDKDMQVKITTKLKSLF
jgi:mRNA interferase MazF